MTGRAPQKKPTKVGTGLDGFLTDYFGFNRNVVTSLAADEEQLRQEAAKRDYDAEIKAANDKMAATSVPIFPALANLSLPAVTPKTKDLIIVAGAVVGIFTSIYFVFKGR